MLKFLRTGNTVLYFGCTVEFGYKELKNIQKSIFDRLGLDFILLSDFICCGVPLKNAGFLNDYEVFKKRVLNVFKNINAKEVICFCPSCCIGLREALEPDINVYFYIDFLYENYIKKFKKFNEEKAFSFHIPCHISRGLKNFDIIKSFLNELNINIKYPEESEDFSICCGGGGSFSNTNPNLSKTLAKEKLEKLNGDVLTCCPMCYHQLKSVSKEKKVFEVSEIIINLL